MATQQTVDFPNRALLAEGDPTSLDAHAAELEASGFAITKARDGTEALAFLASKTFDVILTDFDLPALSGLEIARRARTRFSNVPVIVLSPRSLDEMALRTLTENGFQYLMKPVVPRTLGRTTVRAVRRRAGLIFDNRKGDAVELRSFNATDAKNKFGQMLETTLRDGAAVIRRHDEPKAVLLSWEEFKDLVTSRRPQLAALTSEFDALLAQMQAPAHRQGIQAAFDASPEELGKAAVKAARAGR